MSADLRIIPLFGAVLMLFESIASAQPESDPGRQYLEVYLKINEGEHFEVHNDYASALKDFKDCYAKLLAIHTGNGDWETAVVEHRLNDCRIKIMHLQDKLGDKSPVPDPITTPTGSYPWKTNITFNLFWIGEGGVTHSAWDDDWVKSNGGTDSPDDRNGFSSSDHVDKLNPFYVALPFNDLAHPEVAKKWIPAVWHRQLQEGKPVSACKDRWIEIKNASGRTCYAQWEDVGPQGDADVEYVFGGSLPKVGDQPALLISPAVSQYIGMSGDNSRLSWRFVDEGDVPPGQWLKYSEQGLIYAVMNEQPQL